MPRKAAGAAVSAAAGPHSASFRPARGFLTAALVAIGAAAWHNVLSDGFVFDDDASIVQNEAIRSAWPPWKFLDPRTQSIKEEADRTSWRPLTTFAFSLLYRLGGPDPRVFHAANVAGHVAAALELFLLVGELFGSDSGAFAAALVFLVHPMQTETVAWCTDLANILFLLFYLAALRAFAARPERPWKPLAFFALALLSKEMAVSLPLALAACVPVLRRRAAPRPGPSWRTVAPFFAAAAAYVAARSRILGTTAQTGYAAGGLGPELLVMGKGLLKYLALTLWPRAHCIDYLFPPAAVDGATIAGFAAAAGLPWLAVRLMRGEPMAGFGILLYVFALAPVSNVVPTLHFIAERHLYLPLAGWGLVVAAALDRAERAAGGRPWPRWAALAVLCAGYVPATLRRSADWKDSATLAAADLAREPRSPLLHRMLARGYWDRRDWDAALAEFRRALELSGPSPSYEDYFGIGSAYIRKGDYPRAVESLERALADRPGDIVTRNNLAVALIGAGRRERAAELLRSILRDDPGNSVATRNLGLLR